MTPDLWKALIGAVVGLLLAITALVKVYTDVAKIKAERAETKTTRDADSATLHDQCQKNTWDIVRLKEENSKRDSALISLQANVNELNTNLLLVSQQLSFFGKSITAAIKKLEDWEKSQNRS